METPTTADEGQGAQRAVDQASVRAHERIQRVSDALHPTVDRLANGAHQAVDKLAGVATEATHQFGVRSGQVRDVQRRLTEDCRGYVRDNPMTALAIAAGVGFLVSRLLRINHR